ncbi:MAG: NAD(P)/FAD-dependent oxidoreductase [Nitrospinae bacterium]|nr:NAD(P)/FAD-dependent oxidoreductase [Nitrospinota bacterium]
MVKNSVSVDVAVIGAGPGGTASAIACANGGLKTVLIESGLPGGTCVNRGCVPAKTWIAAGHLLQGLRWGAKIGLPEPHVNFEKLTAHTGGVSELVRKGLSGTLKKYGVEIIAGTASFASPHSLILNGGETAIEFKNAVVAVGSRPASLFAQLEGFYDSDSIFSLPALPSSLAIAGAGAIGVEMACFFRAMGSEVTLLEAMDNILPPVDGEIRNTVAREMKKSGVKIFTGARIANASRTEGKCVLEMDDGSSFKSEVVLTAAGRRPRTEGLGLDVAGVRTDVRGFIDVDGSMATSRGGIFAVGDVAGKALLAYTAHHEGMTAAKTILGKPAHMDYRCLPAIIFASPEIGSVGPTEEQLRQTGVAYRAGRYHIRALARAQACGEIAGLVKVLAGEDGTVLAVHICAPMATEIIHSAVVAVSAGMKAEKLAELPFGHPTFSEAISLAAADAAG